MIDTQQHAELVSKTDSTFVNRIRSLTADNCPDLSANIKIAFRELLAEIGDLQQIARNHPISTTITTKSEPDKKLTRHEMMTRGEAGFNARITVPPERISALEAHSLARELIEKTIALTMDIGNRSISPADVVDDLITNNKLQTDIRALARNLGTDQTTLRAILSSLAAGEKELNRYGFDVFPNLTPTATELGLLENCDPIPPPRARRSFEAGGGQRVVPKSEPMAG